MGAAAMRTFVEEAFGLPPRTPVRTGPTTPQDADVVTDAQLFAMAAYFRRTQPSPLLDLCARATPSERRRLALELVSSMRAGTREGVFRAAAAVAGIGREARAKFLQAAWQAGPSRPAWATALALGWIGGSSLVIAGAGTRDVLREWLSFADLTYPLPFLRRHLVSRYEMPERLILFRGGVVESDELRCGYS
jgi:hypothetical protein